MGEDLRFDLGLLGLFQFLRVAILFSRGSAVAFGIHIGGEQNILAIGRPQLTARFRGDRRQPVYSRHRAIKIVKLRNPNLRPNFFSREEREMASVRSPARAISVLIGDDLALLTTGR